MTLVKGKHIMATDDIMKFESVLPPDFDGVFRFSNPSKEDFIGVWGGKQYLFPALSTVPIVIPEHSPIEIQHIRKKFAKDLAEREFYRSKNYKILKEQEGKPGNRVFNSIHQAASYTMSDLQEYIQKCLQPLPASKLTVTKVPVVPLEEKIHRKEDGSLTTEAIDGKTSLRQKALNS